VTSTEAETRKRIEEREASTNAKLSEKVRTLALGVIGFFWAVNTAEKGMAQAIAGRFPRLLIMVAALAVLSLLADLLDSLFDHFHTDAIKRGSKHVGRGSALFNATRGCFYAKLVAGGLACILLLGVVGCALLKPLPHPSNPTAPPTAVTPASSQPAIPPPADAAPHSARPTTRKPGPVGEPNS
jgi:hypothetical protein